MIDLILIIFFSNTNFSFYFIFFFHDLFIKGKLEFFLLFILGKLQ